MKLEFSQNGWIGQHALKQLFFLNFVVIVWCFIHIEFLSDTKQSHQLNIQNNQNITTTARVCSTLYKSFNPVTFITAL